MNTATPTRTLEDVAAYIDEVKWSNAGVSLSDAAEIVPALRAHAEIEKALLEALKTSAQHLHALHPIDKRGRAFIEECEDWRCKKSCAAIAAAEGKE